MLPFCQAGWCRGWLVVSAEGGIAVLVIVWAPV